MGFKYSVTSGALLVMICLLQPSLVHAEKKGQQIKGLNDVTVNKDGTMTQQTNFKQIVAQLEPEKKAVIQAQPGVQKKSNPDDLNAVFDAWKQYSTKRQDEDGQKAIAPFHAPPAPTAQKPKPKAETEKPAAAD